MPLYSKSKAQSSITFLEDYIVNLESNCLTQQILIDSLEKRLESAEASSANLGQQLNQASQVQETLSKYSKSLESRYRNLRTAFMVTVPVTIIVTGTITWALNEYYFDRL